MTVRNLEFAFRARSIAIIGASPREGSVGRTVTMNVRNGGFEGPIWPVNPQHQTVDGLTCYPNVAALPGRARSRRHRHAGRRPCRASSASSARAAPAPPSSSPPACRARTACARRCSMPRSPTRLRIIGPNCLGLFVPGIGLNASFAHIDAEPGEPRPPVAVRGARLGGARLGGRPAHRLLDRGLARRHGRCRCRRPARHARRRQRHERAILLYLETVTNTRKFISAARAAARLKPVIVIKSGRHAAAAKAAATHTGALAGADGAVDAAFRRAGLLRVRDLEELFDAAETLARFAPIARGRLGIVTNGGGAGVLAVDRLVDFDGELATLAPETIAALDAVLPADLVARQSRSTSSATPARSAISAAIEAVFDDRQCRRPAGHGLPDRRSPRPRASAQRGRRDGAATSTRAIRRAQADPHLLARRS